MTQIDKDTQKLLKLIEKRKNLEMEIQIVKEKLANEIRVMTEITRSVIKENE
jgi:hypothetical protein